MQKSAKNAISKVDANFTEKIKNEKIEELLIFKGSLSR